MQPSDSMIDFLAPAYALLSQHSGQHLQNLRPAHPPAFDEAGDQAHMLHHRRIPRDVILLRFC